MRTRDRIARPTAAADAIGRAAGRGVAGGVRAPARIRMAHGVGGTPRFGVGGRGHAAGTDAVRRTAADACAHAVGRTLADRIGCAGRGRVAAALGVTVAAGLGRALTGRLRRGL